MAKIDLKKDLKHLYKPSAKAVSVENVPCINFLMIDGSGNPNTAQEYKDAVTALYAVAYSLKFKLKQGETGLDYVVMPLEGLWWTDDMSQFSVNNKEAWKWTMMIMQPEHITAELFMEVLPEVEKKKKLKNLDRLKLEPYCEGLVAQIIHIGSYSEEEPTVAKLHEYINHGGYKLRGKHHEIYLGDPRKTQPAKLKTVIRQPFE